MKLFKTVTVLLVEQDTTLVEHPLWFIEYPYVNYILSPFFISLIVNVTITLYPTLLLVFEVLLKAIALGVPTLML